jgi:RNA polymerase-binding transcription factor DksA
MASKKETPVPPVKTTTVLPNAAKAAKGIADSTSDKTEKEEAKTSTKLKLPKATEVAQESPLPKTTKSESKKGTDKATSETKAEKLNQTPVATVKEKTSTEATAKTAAKKTESAKSIKVPKTSATGKVPYEPDFTHSVLDSPPREEAVQQNTTNLRYSDADLVEFKNLIQRKHDAAKKELNYLQGLITRKDEMGGDNDDGRYMTMEDGSLSMEREQLSQMASRQITFIDHLEKALMRIENKTYGVCRVTGKLIDKARLRAVPHATLSMEAKSAKR